MVHWFKKYPEFLRAESWALSHDSNYKELFQKRDQLFVSHGNILVRLDKVYRFPILIVYSFATPYVLPYIYPLTRVLTEEELMAVASDYNFKIPQESISFYHNLRHQNGSGALCFLEWDAFDTGAQFYGITSIISRVKDWYRGHITGEFPPDSEEVALFNHFTTINNQFHILYPESFVCTSHIVQGEFYASIYFLFANDIRYSNIGSAYLGTFITGVSETGISPDAPGDLNVPEHIKDEGLITSLDLQTKPDTVRRLVNVGQLKQGIWFDVDAEPAPFQYFSQLVTIIGNGTSEEGIKRLSAIGYEYFKSLPDDVLVAIRYPNRRQQIEFQAFVIRKVAPTEIIAPPLFCEPLETMKVVVENYSAVDAVACEKFSEETFFQRNTKRANRGVLKNCTANILGVGALGSEIADSLGKAGIGTLLLVDNQRMNAHNVVRHVAGLRQAGQFKVDAMHSQIKEHNPFIKVLALAYSVTCCDIGTELPEDSITISSIADDNIEGYINEQSVIINRPVFYSRALRGGKVGRIIRVIPGVDACLNCLKLYRQSGQEFIEIPSDDNYPILRNECNNPIHPASAADLKLIGALTSRIVIDHLQNGNADVNQWIWSSEIVPNTSLTQSDVVKEQFLRPHVHCQYCNNNSFPDFANIDERVLEYMVELVTNKAGTETGGILAGHIDSNKNISILFASGPGPKAVQSPTRFEKDVEFCQKFLDDLFVEHGDKAIYLGEWHSHPNENNKPSNVDLRSLTDISNQKEYLTDHPIMIIFSKTGIPSCTIHPAGKSYRHISLRSIIT